MSISWQNPACMVPWPRRLFWLSHAPGEPEEGITKCLVGRIQCNHNWCAWVCCAKRGHLMAPLCFQNSLLSSHTLHQGQACALEARGYWQMSSVLFLCLPKEINPPSFTELCTSGHPYPFLGKLYGASDSKPQLLVGNVRIWECLSNKGFLLTCDVQGRKAIQSNTLLQLNDMEKEEMKSMEGPNQKDPLG